MTSTSPKQVIYQNLATVAQALGHAHRLELLELLAQGPRSVEQLAIATELTVANTSRHLQLLRRARLVETNRQGKHIIYSLAHEREVVGCMKSLGQVAELNIAEVQEIMRVFFYEKDTLEAVSREELLTRFKEGNVTLLDVRPKEEFALGHLPGAIHMRLHELEARLAELPKDQAIIAYCRGPYCILSFEAVAALRAKGYQIRRLEDGFPEWKAAGLQVEIGL